MTNVNADTFLVKLYEVVYKLSGIVKTQSYRLKKEWDENLNQLNITPHLIRPIPLDKEKFLNDIDYRINTLDTVRLTFEDGFNSIKSILTALYHHYFNNSSLFKDGFNDEDQLILKYLVAKEILGNLVQYNQLDNKTVPKKYNIFARNYMMIKLKGQRDTEIHENMKKIKFGVTRPHLRKYLDEIISDGFLIKNMEGEEYLYHLEKPLELSEEGKKFYNQTIRPLVEWPTLFWRSYYNIRELNVTVEGEVEYPELLNEVLLKAATQGYIASHYVFKKLVEYYQKIKNET